MIEGLVLHSIRYFTGTPWLAVPEFWVMRLFVLFVHGYDEVYEGESNDQLYFEPTLSEHDFPS